MSFENLKKYAQENPRDENQVEKLKRFQEKMQGEIKISKVQVNKYVQFKREEEDKQIEKFSSKFTLTNQEEE